MAYLALSFPHLILILPSRALGASFHARTRLVHAASAGVTLGYPPQLVAEANITGRAAFAIFRAQSCAEGAWAALKAVCAAVNVPSIADWASNAAARFERTREVTRRTCSTRRRTTGALQSKFAAWTNATTLFRSCLLVFTIRACRARR